MYKDYKGKTSKRKLSQKCARKLDLMAGSERDISIGGIEFHSLGIRLK